MGVKLVQSHQNFCVRSCIGNAIDSSYKFMKFPHQFIRVGSGHKFTHLSRVGSDRVSKYLGSDRVGSKSDPCPTLRYSCVTLEQSVTRMAERVTSASKSLHWREYIYRPESKLYTFLLQSAALKCVCNENRDLLVVNAGINRYTSVDWSIPKVGTAGRLSVYTSRARALLDTRRSTNRRNSVPRRQLTVRKFSVFVDRRSALLSRVSAGVGQLRRGRVAALVGVSPQEAQLAEVMQQKSYKIPRHCVCLACLVVSMPLAMTILQLSISFTYHNPYWYTRAIIWCFLFRFKTSSAMHAPK